LFAIIKARLYDVKNKVRACALSKISEAADHFEKFLTLDD